MKKFNHYEINETVYTSDKFIIYHAHDVENQKPVYLKALKAELPDLKDVARLQREYNLISQFDAPEIIKVIEVVKEGHQFAIVMEDILEGISLQEYCKSKSCEPLEFLNLAIQIVQGLVALQEKKIIHKDIKPSNIIFSQKSKIVKIIDFGISTQLSRENPEVASSNIMEGSLPYISPEQTGMVNTPLDYRTDFYSLGITFYEMLTQEYPFKGNNHKEWTNAHVSTEPKHLHELKPTIPDMICEIIMRLIQKIPKNRYQNFSSLKKDLIECQRQLLENNKIDKFALRVNDLTDHFRISEKLYGRDNEIKQLKESFNTVASGDRSLLLISGYSGSGKSTLVNEIKEHVASKKGYYTTGKVDQYNQNIPYGAFVEAFRQIIKFLFQESDTMFESIVNELKRKLYPNEKLLMDLIPGSQKIFGDYDAGSSHETPQTNMTKLSTLENENRFKLVITNFIKVIARKEHPLVIFLDDLQWASSATFNLLQNIILDEQIESLLIIGAYRDNEITEAHPLSFMINSINKVRPIQRIEVPPLKKPAILQIIADTLHCIPEAALPITEIIYEKTEGNPFFTSELLKSLHRERYIDFNYEQGHWKWDIDKIKLVDISDNVVEFMISRLKQLPDSTLDLLKKASCIGSQFDLNLLAHMAGRKERDVAIDLLKSLQSGILIPAISDYELAAFYDQKTIEGQIKFHTIYRFQHDRIQQAAYEMIEESQKPAIHLMIGKTMLKTMSKERMDGKIVSVADHMNKAKVLITDPMDKLELAELNLAAGIKAKESIAYRTAYEFLKTGISLLDGKCWFEHYDLSFNLYAQFSQSAFLAGELTDAQSHIEILLNHARTPLEKANIYRTRAIQHTINGSADEAVDDCINGLRLLGIKFNKKATTFSVLMELLMAKFRQGFKPIASLASLPRMRNEEKIASMRLLVEMIAPCYTLGNNNLFAKAVLRQVNLSIHHGNTKEAAYAYATYGLLLNAIFNQPSPGFEFGKMAIQLNEMLDDIDLRCRILFVFYSFIFPWNRSIHELYDLYHDIIKVGYQSGDLLYVSYATNLCLILPPKDTLEEHIALGQKYIEMVRATKYENALNFLKVIQQFNLNLRDANNGDYFTLNSDSEVQFLNTLRAAEYDSSITVYLIKKLENHYFFGEYEAAYLLLDECENSLEAMMSSVITEQYYLLATLTLARQYPQLKGKERKKALSRMQGYYRKIKKWASQCKVNFAHHALLLEATLLRLQNKAEKASSIYQMALEAAQQNNFLHDEALICEEIAHFYDNLIDSTNAQKYLTQAHYAYLKWGSQAKISLLEKAHPGLKLPELPPSAPPKVHSDDAVTL